MQDVHRGADAASDHHLVLTKLKLKLMSRVVDKRKNRTRYNVEFLKEKERRETFRLTLSNTYDTLQDLLDEDNMEVNPHWECLKKTWTSTCEEVLGKKKRQHKDWIPLLDELFFILQNNLIPPPVLLFCIQETICRKKNLK